MNIYQEHGYKNRREYLADLADQYGVELSNVAVFAHALGPSEDFDGLIVMIEDHLC